VYVVKSDRLAAGLTALGVKKGDRVGIWAPNCLEWILVQYATARAGFILVRVRRFVYCYAEFCRERPHYVTYIDRDT